MINCVTIFFILLSSPTVSTRKLGTDAASSSDLCVSCLKQRTLVRVAGSDAAPFLQGLITNDMNLLNEDTPSHTKSMYTLMLNVQVGRFYYIPWLWKALSSRIQHNVYFLTKYFLTNYLLQSITYIEFFSIIVKQLNYNYSSTEN